jgi:hypothetical protein
MECRPCPLRSARTCFISRASRRIELESPLRLSECLERLADQMGRRVDDPSKWNPVLPIVGRLRGTVFKARRNLLTMRALGLPVRQRNSFQTVLRARLAEDFGRTRIQCTFSADPFVLAFCVVWVSGVSAGILIEPRAWPVCLGMLAFFALLVTKGRQGAADDRQLLTEFLVSTLKARPVSEP